MTTFGVHSEVGRLRKVMVHRPDLSLKRLTPSNHDDLLFDDVLWVERAQFEHDQFVARMRERDVEVFLFLDLLSEALAASDEGRRRLIEITASEYTVGVTLVEEVRATLWDMKPDQLATHLIGGLTVEESGLDLGRLRNASLPEHLGGKRVDREHHHEQRHAAVGEDGTYQHDRQHGAVAPHQAYHGGDDRARES